MRAEPERKIALATATAVEVVASTMTSMITTL